MKQKRGKKAKYIIYATAGFLENVDWEQTLEDYPTELVCSIRKKLKETVPDLTEKFNYNYPYFGYRQGNGPDKLYLYIQKKSIKIDIQISKEYKKEIEMEGFEIREANNFQAREGWITGWYIPQSTKDITVIMKWLTKPFLSFK